MKPKRYIALIKVLILTTFLLTILTTSLLARPVTQEQAEKAVETFISLRYPVAKRAVARTVTAVGSSHLAVSRVEPWVDSGRTLGFIATLEPSGFVLMRADDLCPPLKVYYSKGDFFSLPPDFLEVLQWELSMELENLYDIQKKKTPLDTGFKNLWSTLVNPTANKKALNAFSRNSPEFEQVGPLLSTRWNQNDPYNYYAPDASGGPGGRAYAGCFACALAQILRYHQWPVAIATNYTYKDNEGACRGMHSASDAGLGDYDWGNMPDSIQTGSSTSQKEAIGQLMYHAGVTIKMDFEHDGSEAYSTDVVNALRGAFKFMCNDLQSRVNYSVPLYDLLWFSIIYTDIVNSRPIFYRFCRLEGGSKGGGKICHGVVVDGARNGNEIHINMGWGGSNNVWYHMNNIETSSGRQYNYEHMAIFQIRPSGSFKISGYIRTSSGTGIPGVVLNGLPGNPKTNNDGYYKARVGSGWSGTVTPQETNYTFGPPSRTYNNVRIDQTNQNYTATRQYTLTVIRAGNGSGTIRSTPPGIVCGNDCTEPYNASTVVTLSAIPDVDSIFTGWSEEGCSGTGDCEVTMDSDKTVTATFAPSPLFVDAWVVNQYPRLKIPFKRSGLFDLLIEPDFKDDLFFDLILRTRNTGSRDIWIDSLVITIKEDDLFKDDPLGRLPEDPEDEDLRLPINRMLLPGQGLLLPGQGFNSDDFSIPVTSKALNGAVETAGLIDLELGYLEFVAFADFTFSDSLGTYTKEFDVNFVPEPSTLLLLGAGLIGVLALRRRRTKK